MRPYPLTEWFNCNIRKPTGASITEQLDLLVMTAIGCKKKLQAVALTTTELAELRVRLRPQPLDYVDGFTLYTAVGAIVVLNESVCK